MRDLIAIALVQESNMGIGYGNDLLYSIERDMKRFRSVTRGHAVLYGRKTFESMGSKPLPKRVNIVLTRDPDFCPPGVVVAHSWKAAERLMEDAWSQSKKVFVIGGEQIYRLALPYVTELDLTLVSGTKSADVFFPKWGPEFKSVCACSPVEGVDRKDGQKVWYRFETWKKDGMPPL